MSDLVKKRTIILHHENGISINCEPKKFKYPPDRVEAKTKYQLVDKDGNILSPEVDDIIYDEKTKVFLFEDSIVLDGGNSVTFRYMTDITGRQIGGVGNDYDTRFDEINILGRDENGEFTRYEDYKNELKERLQRKVDRKRDAFLEAQEGYMKLEIKKGQK